MKYLVVFQTAENNKFSAFAPDVPTCVVTGDSEEQTRARIRDALYISTHCPTQAPAATAFTQEIDSNDASEEVRALMG